MTAPEFPAAPPRQSQGRIPPRLQDAYKAYVIQHYRRFLLAINFIAMAAYDSYVLADALLIPDMAKESLLLRSGLSLIGLLNIFLVFRFSRSVLVMDMLMPLHDIVSTIAWFELLKRSASPEVPFFLYASVVFILLGNLGVRYSFKGIALVSAIISAIILYNVWLIHDGAVKPLLIFTLVYLPIALFSLFISWTNIKGVRQAFLADLEERRQRAELASLNLRLQELATTDGLTGVGNRRALDLQLNESWHGMRAHGRPFALLMADIDYFKPYNDHYGHQAGDRCLCQVAENLVGTLRGGRANVYRYGGEEFAILLEATNAEDLRCVAERLREQVASQGIEHLHRPDSLRQLTISLGAAMANEGGLHEPRELLARCDRHLYIAKQKGRNRVQLSGMPGV
ncbi:MULTISPECIES: GGDEF domain-containing protein [Pseudomonas]|uniref:GGDEF domain-containing protein n=1 Tax=Pseudomonas nitroreducens TaxID=46680 RepID=UPI001E57C70F|nr:MULTISPECIES: GGDEF domain-containing protein [Pseudomonas]MCE4072536.1 GGDEF domain-containing protein [Pseudomonas nitritireducens]MCE4081600.1 GGDEF domain-containing protein [Pseudomonas nitroreducens]